MLDSSDQIGVECRNDCTGSYRAMLGLKRERRQLIPVAASGLRLPSGLRVARLAKALAARLNGPAWARVAGPSSSRTLSSAAAIVLRGSGAASLAEVR